MNVRELPWSEEIAARLTHEASRSCLPWLGREVQAGQSQLWECSDDKDVLHVITRLDHQPPELVLCYGQGRGVAKFIPQFIAKAAALGLPLRMHTTDPGMVRMARRYGFRLSEYIVRCSHA